MLVLWRIKNLSTRLVVNYRDFLILYATELDARFAETSGLASGCALRNRTHAVEPER